MKITIIGAGYVGLVSGVCLAEYGHDVCCVDVSEDKIAGLREGTLPIYEPGLDALLNKNVSAGRLSFTTDYAQSVPESEVVFIAVGTPTSRRGDGYADMGYVYEAAEQIAQHLTGYTVIVNKSTVPVGSAQQVERVVRDVNPQADFDVASNPEFLREGVAVRDFMEPDRVVVGTNAPQAQAVMKQVYQPLADRGAPVMFTSAPTAELTKYACNAFLATKVSFINEIANLCEAVGGDVQALADAMGKDHRIGDKFLQAGPGYGGSCFPKDTTALLRIAQEQGLHCRITEAAVEVNHAQKARMVGKIRDALGAEMAGKTVAVLGLTFKPETDDMRDAPSLTILPSLVEKGVRIVATDPQGMREARELLPDLEYVDDPYTACEGADAVCILTEWQQYCDLDLSRIAASLRTPVLIDLRNVYDAETATACGLNYVCVGRDSVRVTAQAAAYGTTG